MKLDGLDPFHCFALIKQINDHPVAAVDQILPKTNEPAGG